MKRMDREEWKRKRNITVISTIIIIIIIIIITIIIIFIIIIICIIIILLLLSFEYLMLKLWYWSIVRNKLYQITEISTSEFSNNMLSDNLSALFMLVKHWFVYLTVKNILSYVKTQRKLRWFLRCLQISHHLKYDMPFS